MKGLIHYHTHHSYDCIQQPKDILAKAQAAKLDFLVITDHDTIAGSLEMRELLKAKDLHIEVPIAAEYYTDHGDVIAVGIKDEIVAREFHAFCAEVRAQGGLLLLPHPFMGHRDIEMLAQNVDVIEVYNPRQGIELDEKAMDLALRHGKPYYHGSDGHLLSNFSDCFIEYEDVDLQDALLGNSRMLQGLKATQLQIYRTQYIKAWKRRSPSVFMKISFSMLKYIGRQVLNSFGITK